MLKAEPGIYHGCKPADYFKLGVVREDGSIIERGSSEYIMSRSSLRDFARCPQAWQLGLPRKASKAFAWGSLIDGMLLTPDMLDELIVVQPETYSNAPEKGRFILSTEFDGEWNPRTKACREWKKEKESMGWKIYTPEQYAEACEEKKWNANSDYCKKWIESVPAEVDVISSGMMAEAEKAMLRIEEDVRFSHILGISQTQTVIVWDWTCPVSGEIIRCKAMLDIVPPAETGVLLDLKTTVDAHPVAWSHHVKKYGYHYQGAMYMDGYNAAADAMGQDDYRDTFGHLIQESSAPYETARRVLENDWITVGRVEYEADLMRYATCRVTGNFPGYSENTEDGFERVECPSYLRPAAEQKRMDAQDEALDIDAKWQNSAAEEEEVCHG